MRKLFLAATALASSVIFLVPGAQAFDWNGAYVGGTLGVVKSTGDVEFNNDEGGSETLDFDGFGVIAGVTTGFNFVLSNDLVVGVEADASLMGVSSSEQEEFFAATERLNSLLTLRGRFGVVKGETLFYATAGLAGGRVESTSTLFATEVGTSGFVPGVVAGLGVEHAIAENLTVKGEVLAFRLKSQSNGDSGKGFTSTYNPSGVVFRTGINFHF